MGLVLALFTDTHVRPLEDDGQNAFPSDAHHNDRNREAARILASMGADVAIHLGDVVHPIPTLPTHESALAVAKQIYGDLGCPLMVVPGNHDVGDKRSSASAPIAVQVGREAFRRTWGPPFHSRDIAGVHLVVVDGGLLGASTEEAQAQRAWLKSDLAGGHERILVFTHYPPFLHRPDEDEHYDNLGEPGRTWLLDLLADHRVEAVFSGHVHRFFYNRYRGMDLYTLPSTAFVRPEYAALRPIPPSDAENGRDDREHLGLAKLTLDEGGHRLEVFRPHSRAPGGPAATRRLGCWLRHRLGRVSELPYGDLDALSRKTAADDASMLQVLDLGLSRIRIPLADLREPAVVERVRWLTRQGVALSVFSAGPPTEAHAALVTGFDLVTEWEVVCRPSDLVACGTALQGWAGPKLTLGRIGRSLAGTGGYFSHFPREGFEPADPALDGLLPCQAIQRVAFRIADHGPAEPQVAAALARAQALGVGATLHVELPYNTESSRQTDHARVQERVLAADRVAQAHPEALVFLDLLADKDRGYWCRDGLVSTVDEPHPAYQALKAHTPR
jgi:predicted phosphodiesterase